MYELNHAAIKPWRAAAHMTQMMLRHPMNPAAHTAPGRAVAAAADVFEGITRRYGKPSFGLDEITIDGAPVPVTDCAARALRLARALIDELHPQMQADAGGLGLGVGVATGDVSVGAVRGAGRLEYAAVGSAVNLAARLCAAAPGGEVWVDAASVVAAGETAVQARTPLTLKGYAEPVQLYALVPDPNP